MYTRFARLPLAHRLTALPLLGVVADFDPRRLDDWARYDNVTARELFAAHGVSRRLYKEAFEPMLLVGLFAPGEECSAAAAMGMLLYVWARLAAGRNGSVVWAAVPPLWARRVCACKRCCCWDCHCDRD